MCYCIGCEPRYCYCCCCCYCNLLLAYRLAVCSCIFAEVWISNCQVFDTDLEYEFCVSCLLARLLACFFLSFVGVLFIREPIHNWFQYANQCWLCLHTSNLCVLSTVLWNSRTHERDRNRCFRKALLRLLEGELAFRHSSQIISHFSFVEPRKNFTPPVKLHFKSN